MYKVFMVCITLSMVVFSKVAIAAEDTKDKCDGVESSIGYATHFIDIEENKRSKMTEYCQIYLGIKNKEPEYINNALTPIIERSNGLAFLKDIDFKIKTFEAKDSENGLGFSYDYSKTTELTDFKYHAENNVTTGISWNFTAKGNVAFDSQINPADFLDTRVSISGFRDYGGISKVATKAMFDNLDKLDVEAAELTGEELVDNRKKIKKIVNGFFTTQTYIDFDLNAGLESNQRFTQKQWTYGAKVALDIKSYGKNSSLGTWNIFDYPFALIRILSGYDGSDSFKPLGSTFPTFVLGIDQVDPIDNDAREAVGEKEKFSRLKGEMYFRTPIAHIKSQEIYFNIDYRFWNEISASDVIKSTGIDNFNYTTMSISSSNGVFISYSNGMLPFDLKTQQVYELGWKFHFD